MGAATASVAVAEAAAAAVTATATAAAFATTFHIDDNMSLHYTEYGPCGLTTNKKERLCLSSGRRTDSLKTIVEGLRHASSSPVSPKVVCGSPKPGKSTHFFGILSANAVVKKRSTSQPRASTISASSQQPDVENGTGTAAGKLIRVNSLTKKHATGENFLRKSLWASRSKVLDIDEKLNKEMQQNTTVNVDKFKDNETRVSEEAKIEGGGNEELQIKGTSNSSSDDMVSGILYDRLQKEVITLRKSLETRDTILTAKDEELKILKKKVDTLVKALEVESKNVKKEAATREQDAASAQVDDNKKNRKTNSSKRVLETVIEKQGLAWLCRI
ncbi:hypothetical protein RJ640_000140 [Escallonia rubra]|uniref:Uncharacterized protein n=1 Tax=Escallonia rubra TaxID=112253 RepID=A0AA88URI7_9ASTE|nr:hypothetical protein RJ640_000140 [Escallonia rubra]